jgi:hypothetical protein
VLPLIRQRWPAAAATVSRSAQHLSEARALLEQLAIAGLHAARDGAALRASALRRLPLPQRRNALRQWIAERGLRRRIIGGCARSAARCSRPGRCAADGQLARRPSCAATPIGCSHLPACGGERPDRRRAMGLARAALAAAERRWRARLVRDRHGDVRLSALRASAERAPPAAAANDCRARRGARR